MDSESTPANEHSINESQPVATAQSEGGRGEHRQRCELLGIAWHERPVAADAAAVALIDPEVAVRLRVVPIRFDDLTLVLAMLDPLDTDAADEISALTGRPVLREGMEKKHFSNSCGSTTGPPPPRWPMPSPATPTTPTTNWNTTSRRSKPTTSTGWRRNPPSSIW